MRRLLEDSTALRLDGGDHQQSHLPSTPF